MKRQCFDCKYGVLLMEHQFRNSYQYEMRAEFVHECHRHAVQPNGTFPEVVGSNWCGEFLRRSLSESSTEAPE
jgi:hypothetical protein